MKFLPLLYSYNLKTSVDFYTKILDFTLIPPGTINDPVVNLHRGDAVLQLTTMPTDQVSCVAVYAVVTDIDALFALYIKRGLDTSSRPESPVHQAPLNQTWGTREFYVTDPDGNTIRFVQY